jgi:hypothetical protein
VTFFSLCIIGCFSLFSSIIFITIFFISFFFILFYLSCRLLYFIICHMVHFLSRILFLSKGIFLLKWSDTVSNIINISLVETNHLHGVVVGELFS